MTFHGRLDAALQLAAALDRWRGKRPLVIALPRGAVPMGEVIARQLEGDLDVILIRKLRAPNNPELAIGAVAESGWVQVADYVGSVGADEAYVEAEIATQLAIIRMRRAKYDAVARSVPPKGRVVIIVDDGIATGATMEAALHAIREQGPARLVCAVPVASRESLGRVSAIADDVVCLEKPSYFSSVSQFYNSFEQVEDDEVVAALQASRKRGTVPQPERH